MSVQFSIDKAKISPIYGYYFEKHGRNPRKVVRIGWDTEDTRHYGRRAKCKRAKNITLRTHRIGR